MQCRLRARRPQGSNKCLWSCPLRTEISPVSLNLLMLQIWSLKMRIFSRGSLQFSTRDHGAPCRRFLRFFLNVVVLHTISTRWCKKQHSVVKHHGQLWGVFSKALLAKYGHKLRRYQHSSLILCFLKPHFKRTSANSVANKAIS